MSTTEKSTGAIHFLNSEVIDQIAAGEVVERPAHLVKELVENALDAGSSSIEVEYDQGGRRVRVTDDGSGISEKDLALALARHATSKINVANDLWSLSTFGFRGEALSSIGAVSRLTLASRVTSSPMASKVTAEFGRIGAVQPIGGNVGTTILVEELFANVPARLKFMKTEGGESAQIKATLRALALANENVEFRVRTKGKIDSVWPKAENFLERAKTLLGIENLYSNHFEYEGFRAEVVFASPHNVAGNARNILIFVQGRWVQDRGLQAAVIDAFRGLLMHGEYPIAVVRLTAPVGDVDVNIHPTKSQIKFRDAQAPFRAVNRALRDGIEKAPWLEQSSGTESSRKVSVAELTRPYNSGHSPSEDEVAVAVNQQIIPEPTPSGSIANAPVHSIGRFEGAEFDAVMFRQKQDFGTHLNSSTIRAGDVTIIPDVQSPPSPVHGFPVGKSGDGVWSRLQVIGQADLTYIIAQNDKGIVLVDQHAAHERVAYERLMRSWLSGSADVQALLIPLPIELEPDGAEALLSIASELEGLGVTLDQVGPQAVAVRSRPTLISDKALKVTLMSLAREIVERGGSFKLEKKIGDLCASMACHSVVRAGQSLSVEQMKSLLVQMDEFPLSSFCPHGRPVSVEYPFAKLERDFGRIV